MGNTLSVLGVPISDAVIADKTQPQVETITRLGLGGFPRKAYGTFGVESTVISLPTAAVESASSVTAIVLPVMQLPQVVVASVSTVAGDILGHIYLTATIESASTVVADIDRAGSFPLAAVASTSAVTVALRKATVDLSAAAIASTSEVTTGQFPVARGVSLAVVATTSMVTGGILRANAAGTPRRFLKTRRRTFKVRTATTPIA